MSREIVCGVPEEGGRGGKPFSVSLSLVRSRKERSVVVVVSLLSSEDQAMEKGWEVQRPMVGRVR